MDYLLEGFKAVGDNPKMLAMWVIGALLIYLAIKKDMEPALLLPMGFGAILVNLPLSPVIQEGGIIRSLFKVGIEASEAMPLLLFIGIGCMIDFGPLLTNPKLFILGGAAQLGIFVTIILSVIIGFPLTDAASIGIIGAAGISAFPMAARVVEKVGIKEDSSNHLLMHAVGANVSGQIASAIVGGLIIGLVL